MDIGKQKNNIWHRSIGKVA